MDKDKIKVRYYYGDTEDYDMDVAEGIKPAMFDAKTSDEFMFNLWNHSHFTWLCNNTEEMKQRLVARYSQEAKNQDLSSNDKFQKWLLKKHLVIKIATGGH